MNTIIVLSSTLSLSTASFAISTITILLLLLNINITTSSHSYIFPKVWVRDSLHKHASSETHDHTYPPRHCRTFLQHIGGTVFRLYIRNPAQPASVCAFTRGNPWDVSRMTYSLSYECLPYQSLYPHTLLVLFFSVGTRILPGGGDSYNTIHRSLEKTRKQST